MWAASFYLANGDFCDGSTNNIKIIFTFIIFVPNNGNPTKIYNTERYEYMLRFDFGAILM